MLKISEETPRIFLFVARILRRNLQRPAFDFLVAVQGIIGSKKQKKRHRKIVVKKSTPRSKCSLLSWLNDEKKLKISKRGLISNVMADDIPDEIKQFFESIKKAMI